MKNPSNSEGFYSGEPPETRTRNPLIKSVLLCLFSTRGVLVHGPAITRVNRVANVLARSNALDSVLAQSGLSIVMR